MGTNGDVVVTVAAKHNIHIESQIVSGSGVTTHVVWTQQLSYSNTQSFLNNTLIQVNSVFKVEVYDLLIHPHYPTECFANI